MTFHLDSSFFLDFTISLTGLFELLQSNWKGYIARRDAKGQLVDLRHRVQKSAANVDDGMRLINRHIAALNELLSMKSLSNILRNCATLGLYLAYNMKLDLRSI